MHGALKTQMYYGNDEYNYNIDDDRKDYDVCTAMFAAVTELFNNYSKEQYSIEELAKILGEYEFTGNPGNDIMGPSFFYRFTYGDYDFSVESDHANPIVEYIYVYSSEKAGAKSIGGIEPYQIASDVIRIIGEPESKSVAVYDEATGRSVQEWHYPSIGIVLEMFETGYGQRVKSISAQSPCTLKTPSGIGIGSLVSDAQRIYRDGIDPEENFIDYATVVGSIYDGLIFRHDLKNEKIIGILIGEIAK